jgi:hypothetical protein
MVLLLNVEMVHVGCFMLFKGIDRNVQRQFKYSAESYNLWMNSLWSQAPGEYIHSFYESGHHAKIS